MLFKTIDRPVNHIEDAERFVRYAVEQSNKNAYSIRVYAYQMTPPIVKVNIRLGNSGELKRIQYWCFVPHNKLVLIFQFYKTPTKAEKYDMYALFNKILKMKGGKA